MIRRLVLAVLAVASCAPAFAQDGKTRRTEGVVFLRTSAPTLTDDLRVGDWWIDTDSGTAPPTAYILTDLTPTWTVLPSGGGGGAPTNAEYWVGTADATLSAEKNLGALGTGLVINTGGVPSTYGGGICGVGYVHTINASGSVTCSMPALNDLIDPLLGDILYSNAIHSWTVLGGNTTTTKKFLSQTGTGAASAAPSWVAIGSVCTTPQFSRGVLDDTSASCAQPGFSEISGTVSDAQVPNNITIDLATAATALAANGSNCASAGDFAKGVTAAGAAECGTIADADIPNNITITLAATATALAANGGNCGAGQAAAGVDASGVAEGCFAPTAGAHNLLSVSHGDTVASSPVEGDLIVGNVSGAWEALPVSATPGDMLRSTGSAVEWFSPPAYAPTAAEYIVAEANGTLSAEVAPSAANQVPVSSSSTAAAWGTVPIQAGGTGQTTRQGAFDALSPTSTTGQIIYHNGSNNVALVIGPAYSLLRMNSADTAPEWGHRVVPLTGNVGVAASASYTTVFSTTPVASKTNLIEYHILHTASATTVGVQFRVSSADAGNVGNCWFSAHGIAATAASAVAEEYDVIAIGAAPADNGAAAAGFTAMNLVDIYCQFTSDGTPGAVLLEAQLETGTTSINVLAGSYYTYIFN